MTPIVRRMFAAGVQLGLNQHRTWQARLNTINSRLGSARSTRTRLLVSIMCSRKYYDRFYNRPDVESEVRDEGWLPVHISRPLDEAMNFDQNIANTRAIETSHIPTDDNA